MIRAATVVAMLLLATAAASQTAKSFREAPEAVKSPTQIPDVPAGADPMNRQPDPAGGTPAARPASKPAERSPEKNCRVRRADTDTGFVVVCEEDG